MDLIAKVGPDTGGPLGRAVTLIIAAISELERHLIVDRVRSGMRRAKLEGRRLGRPPLPVDVESLVRDRQGGLSMSQLANQYQVAETTVRRLLRQAAGAPPKRSTQPTPQLAENTRSVSAV